MGQKNEQSLGGWVAGIALALGCGLVLLWRAERAPRAASERAPATASGRPAPGPARDSDEPAAQAVAPERNLAATSPAVPRDLALRLERFPDRSPLAHALVELTPRADEGGAWLVTDGEGRVEARVPTAARDITVSVAGFEPARTALEPTLRELRLALTPSAALFGRVLREDGTPAAGAEVRLEALRVTASVVRDRGETELRSSVQLGRQLVGAATANAEGWYVLERAVRDGPESVELRAVLTELEARQKVELPRAAEAVPDLVLGPAQHALTVRVVDLDGRPIPDANVSSLDNPLSPTRSRTNERGELVLASVVLPATFNAHARGFLARELRHDGLPVPPPGKIEQPIAVLEIVMAPIGGTQVRIVDAETRFPIFLAHCRCDLYAGSQSVGSSDFEPDRDGLAWVFFVDMSGREEPPVEPETARISVEKQGYEPGQVFELDARAPRGPEPIELALRPLAGWQVLRGRVVRAGEPLARFQVGMKVQPRGDDPMRTGWQYGRAYTDGQGRFSLRWQPDAFAQVVTVYPHWTSWDEFAFLGPMSEEEATAREHVLELGAAIHVPAVLRGVTRGGLYRYYVALVTGEGDTGEGDTGEGDERVIVPTTINGVPIEVREDGELRTLLRLPADRRVQVTIGHVSGNSLKTDGSPPVVHDPAHPELPLVFEVAPIFARVRGQVVGLAPDELARVGVVLAAAPDKESGFRGELTPVRPDGSFELRASLGSQELCLIDATPGEWRAVLARRPLELRGDVEGLVLAPEARPGPK